MGSFWKKAWQGSGSGRVSFLGKEISGSVSFEWRSGGYREKNQRRRRGGEREFFRRSTCVLLRASGRGTFIRIQKQNWVEAEEEEDGREEVDSRR